MIWVHRLPLLLSSFDMLPCLPFNVSVIDPGSPDTPHLVGIDPTSLGTCMELQYFNLAKMSIFLSLPIFLSLSIFLSLPFFSPPPGLLCPWFLVLLSNHLGLIFLLRPCGVFACLVSPSLLSRAVSCLGPSGEVFSKRVPKFVPDT